MKKLQLVLLTLFAFKCFSQVIFKEDAAETDTVPMRKTRSIPYPGQALQATSQVLNHPIVAAALQRISMNALATVASALNQVHQEELAKKSEVEKTLDSMASLKSTEKEMPLLQDDASVGSGDTEDAASGSGAGSGNGDASQDSTDTAMTSADIDDYNNNKTTNIDDNLKKSKSQNKHHHHGHHHHRRHHHHRHHHKKSKKSEKQFAHLSQNTTLDWANLQNNTKIVGEIAEEANIPVKKLLAIFRSGASRSDIAKQTEELLNRTIESQAQLAELFEKEEENSKNKNGTDIKEEKSETNLKDTKHKKGKTTEKIMNVSSKNVTFDVPKNIPPKCAKIVKQYTDGELTLKDYLKELRVCKKNDEVSKQLANTTPMQREAVATQNLIQQEAYNYALNTMSKNYKPTVKEQANAVIEKWRSNSFGDKATAQAAKSGAVPDAVKSFMNIQTPAEKNIEKAKETIAETSTLPSQSTSMITETNQGPFEAARSTILKHVTGSTTSNLVDPEASSLNPTDPETLVSTQNEIESATLVNNNDQVFKKSQIPTSAVQNTNNAFVNKLNLISTDENTPLQSDPGKQNILMANTILPVNNAALTSEQSAAMPNGALNFLTKNTLTKSIVPNPSVTSVTQNQQISNAAMSELSQIPVNTKSKIPGSIMTQEKKTLISMPSALTEGVQSKILSEPAISVKSEITEKNDITASNIFNDPSLDSEHSELLTGQELAAEAYIASLANPVLQEIPVDTSLVAALRSLSGYQSPVENNPKDNLLLASLQKRDITDQKQRFAKRDISNEYVTLKHKSKPKKYSKLRKRDTSSDKIKIAKPIERSGLPLVNSGPKLMDKIRDMSRVIAKP